MTVIKILASALLTSLGFGAAVYLVASSAESEIDPSLPRLDASVPELSPLERSVLDLVGRYGEHDHEIALYSSLRFVETIHRDGYVCDYGLWIAERDMCQEGSWSVTGHSLRLMHDGTDRSDQYRVIAWHRRPALERAYVGDVLPLIAAVED